MLEEPIKGRVINECVINLRPRKIKDYSKFQKFGTEHSDSDSRLSGKGQVSKKQKIEHQINPWFEIVAVPKKFATTGGRNDDIIFTSNKRNNVKLNLKNERRPLW